MIDNLTILDLIGTSNTIYDMCALAYNMVRMDSHQLRQTGPPVKPTA